MPPSRPPPGGPVLPPGRHPYAAEALVVWVGVFAASVVAMGLAPPGVTWDETFYIFYGRTHLEWLTTLGPDRLNRAGIEAAWRVGSEHPPLATLAIGLAHEVLGGKSAGINPVAGRGATVVEYALLVTAVFAFVARRWGRWAGRLAALALVAMPRLFAHGQLAATDLSMALVWFLSVWTFVRCLERPRIGRACLAGLALGGALLTKMNGVFLPLILAPWALVVYRRRALWPIIATCAIGVALFFLGWPWMWIDTLGHLREYLLRGTERARILVYYLGRSIEDVAVPWHYPLVMTAATVPVGVLSGAVAGAVDGLARPGRRALVALLLANIAVPLGVFAVPGVPVYDGVRLFLHVFPFVACLAGAGGVAVIRAAARRGLAASAAQGVVVGIALIQMVPVVGTAPFGLSYYNLLVGGPAGADRLGFETTYWGDAMDQALLVDLAATIPRGSRVAIFPLPTDVILPYYAEQLERLGLTPVAYVPPARGQPPYEFLIVVCRKGYFDEFVWGLFRDRSPLLERRLRFFGSVPLCRVYDIRGAAIDE